MHPDLVEIEDLVHQADVPIGGAARAHVAQHLGTAAREMLGPDGRDGAGAHVCDAAGVEDGPGHAGAGIEQHQERQFGREPQGVVVDEVAHDLDAGRVHRLPQGAAQHVEVAARHAGLEVHAGLDDGLAPALGGEARLHGREDLVVGHGEGRDIRAVQEVDVDLVHHAFSRPAIQPPAAVEGVTHRAGPPTRLRHGAADVKGLSRGGRAIARERGDGKRPIAPNRTDGSPSVSDGKTSLRARDRTRDRSPLHLVTTDGDHGRIEQRHRAVIHDVGFLGTDRRFPGEPRFPGPKAIAMVETEVERNGKPRRERRFSIGSLPLNPDLFAQSSSQTGSEPPRVRTRPTEHAPCGMARSIAARRKARAHPRSATEIRSSGRH